MYVWESHKDMTQQVARWLRPRYHPIYGKGWGLGIQSRKAIPGEAERGDVSETKVPRVQTSLRWKSYLCGSYLLVLTAF